jgi:hypothetical protein
MKNPKWILLILAEIFLLPVLSWAQVGENYTVELEGRYWRPQLDSTVRIVDNGVGQDFKLVEDLGFEEQQDSGEGRLQIKFARRHKINFSYLPLNYDGDKFLTRTIEFSGQVYPVGARVRSEMDLKMFKAGYEYDFISGPYGFLGATLDVLVADLHLELKAPDLGIDEKEDATVPIPLIGLNGRLPLGRLFALTAKISGLLAGGYGYIYDAEGSLDFNPVRYVGISAGYRFFGAKADIDDDSVDLKLQGPFASLKIRF